MTFTFKLARRLAQSHLAILALSFLTGSCAPGKPLEGGLEPPPDDVLAIHLVPDSVSLNPAEFVDFTAVAELSSGENGTVAVTWTAQGGTISSTGRFTAGSTAGVYRVIGQYQNGPADTATVVVTVVAPPPPVLTRINVTPGTVALLPSATQQFAAAGVMSDGSSSTVSVTWTTTGGIIDPNGLYSAPGVAGGYLVVASQQGGGLSDTAQVTVTIPPPTLTAVILTPASASLEFGQTRQFSAVGQLSDGSSTSIAVTWTSTGGSVNSTGLYTAGNTAGSFRVIARSANGLADTSAITISAPTITAISLTPASVSLQSGQTQQFSVSASLSNGGTQSNPPVTWVATGGAINASGLYTAGATAGNFQVIATSANGKADTSAVSVSFPTITAIIVTPASVTLGGGQTQQFSASATLSNGGTQANPSVTWSATGGTVSTGGLYTAGTTAGPFRVIAVSTNGRADTSAVTISAATVTAINLTPATVSLQSGQTQQFSVSATMSDGSTQPNPTVTYSATGGTVSTGGLYTAGATAGTFRVIASASGKADTSAITITAATITALNVTPATIGLAAGESQQYLVSATLSNGGTQNNPSVTWSATGGSITTGGNYTAGGTAGSFRVIATAANGVADTGAVTLTVPIVIGISTSPASVSLGTGQSQQFSAASLLSGGGTLPNAIVTWSATGGTITTGGLYTAGGTTGSFRVIAVLVGGLFTDTSTVTIAASSGNNMYFNSAEAGCGSDSNTLFCDDFEDGDWYSKDCDQANSSGGLLQTDGWCGNIYANPVTPAGAAVCGNRGFRSNCTATSGDLTGQQGRNMADHGYNGNVQLTEASFRLYFQPQADYNGGHEKMFDFTRGSGTGQLVALCYNYFSSETIRCMPYLHQDDGLPGSPVGGAWLGSNVGSELTLIKGHWYFFEMHVRLNTPGSYDGLFEWWLNDCGTDGSGCTGTPTLRGQFTNVKYRNAGAEASVTLGGNWIENWANAPSVGTLYYDNVRAGRTPIGFVP